jgi:hypothetical protein
VLRPVYHAKGNEMTDGNTAAIERMMADREEHDERREAEQELQDLRDEVDALAAKLAEVEARTETALATARRDALLWALASMVRPDPKEVRAHSGISYVNGYTQAMRDLLALTTKGKDNE